MNNEFNEDEPLRRLHRSANQNLKTFEATAEIRMTEIRKKTTKKGSTIFPSNEIKETEGKIQYQPNHNNEKDRLNTLTDL